MLSIKINITYIIIKLICYTSNFNNIYFITVKRIYKYLKDIKDYSIIYYKNKNYFLSRYYNADYINNIKSLNRLVII